MKNGRSRSSCVGGRGETVAPIEQGSGVATVTSLRRDWSGLRRWGQRLRRAGHKLYAAPLPVRIAAIAITVLLAFTAINLVYQVLRKPAEIFVLVSGALNKAPVETWRQYAALFREYSTPAITPELLAALAQVEGAGNPVARTYWRWRPSWNPFALYQPASSGVGMYQMTDAAFAEARRFCIRNHIVVEDACWFSGFYSRVLPSHAIELTAVYLDRNLGAVLAGHPSARRNAEHKEELAALIHLCGASAAKAFARRGFGLTGRRRCGDHDAATYLARVKEMEREFLRLAASR
jgi:hypothetical protein